MTVSLVSLLDRLAQPRVLVLGDFLLDRYTWGDAERVSPEAPVLVLRAGQCLRHAGRLASAAGGGRRRGR